MSHNTETAGFNSESTEPTDPADQPQSRLRRAVAAAQAAKARLEGVLSPDENTPRHRRVAVAGALALGASVLRPDGERPGVQDLAQAVRADNTGEFVRTGADMLRHTLADLAVERAGVIMNPPVEQPADVAIQSPDLPPVGQNPDMPLSSQPPEMPPPNPAV